VVVGKVGTKLTSPTFGCGTPLELPKPTLPKKELAKSEAMSIHEHRPTSAATPTRPLMRARY
jgi:hypothetical protein